MDDESDNPHLNNIFGRIAILDEGKKLLFRGTFAEGLLDIEDLNEHRPFKYQDPLTGEYRIPDFSWLEAVLAPGRLRFPDLEGETARKAPVGEELDHKEILKKDPYAGIKRRLLRAVFEAGIDPNDPALGSRVRELWAGGIGAEAAAIAEANPSLASLSCPKASTIRRWMRRLDPALATLADMMSKRGMGVRKSDLDPEVIAILEKRALWFYAARGRRKADILPAIEVDIAVANRKRNELGLSELKCPSKETIRRYVDRAHNRDTFAEKFGEAAAKSRWDGAGKSLTANKILAVGLIDDTVLDAMVVFDADRNVPCGRPWLIAIMDVYSRCIVGWCLEFVPPSVHTAAECVRRANRPKAVRPELAARYKVLSRIYGKFDRLVSDNGTNFASIAFQEIMADLGTTLQFTSVGAPRHKAMLERFFFTLKTWLLEKIPGHTLTPQLLKEFDIDPAKQAVFTKGEIELLIAEFIANYHITVHSGINTQPANRWMQSAKTHGRNIIGDDRKLAILTAVTKHNRRLYRGAVRMFGLTFRDAVISAELNDDLVHNEPHRKRVKSGAAVATVKVKYDPANLRCVWVWNPVTGRWVELPCTDLVYADGLSLWQHKQVRDWAKRKNLEFNSEEERLEARWKLNELIVEMAPGMASRERRAVARMLGAPSSGDLDVETVEAPPRHDGMAPVIEHSTNERRADRDLRPTRPGDSDLDATASDGADFEEQDDLAEGDGFEDEDDLDQMGLDTGDNKPPVDGEDDDDSRFQGYFG